MRDNNKLTAKETIRTFHSQSPPPSLASRLKNENLFFLKKKKRNNYRLKYRMQFYTEFITLHMEIFDV